MRKDNNIFVSKTINVGFARPGQIRTGDVVYRCLHVDTSVEYRDLRSRYFHTLPHLPMPEAVSTSHHEN